jgi:N-acetylneuraminic acid mutarotase
MPGPAAAEIVPYPPSVLSIARADANPTAATEVHYTVVFSTSVTGVDPTDFLVERVGISSASISAVSADTGSTRTVTVAVGPGTGTFSLNLLDDDTIVDSTLLPLGGSGADPVFVGELYEIKPCVEVTPITPADGLRIGQGQTSAVVLAFVLQSQRSDLSLDAISFRAFGNANDYASIRSAALYIDYDADRRLTPVDGMPIAVLGAYLEDDGLLPAPGWNCAAGMIRGRYGAASAVVDGKAYIFGGFMSSFSQEIVDTTEVYDPRMNVWETKTPMPAALAVMACAVYQGRIYVIGGMDSALNPVNSVFRYDPLADSWATMAPAPANYYGMGAATLNNKIYAAGGTNGSENSFAADVYVYDPASNAWSAGEPMLVGRREFSLVNAGGKLLAIGQHNFSDPLSVEEFDPATSTWTAKASHPMLGGTVSACCLNGAVYAICGDAPNTSLSVYDSIDNVWNIGPDMPSTRYLATAAVLAGKFYAFGGINDNGVSNLVDAYAPGPPPAMKSGKALAGGTWQGLPAELALGRTDYCAPYVGGKFYVIGGQNGGVAVNTVQEVDARWGGVVDKAPMPTARMCAAAAVANDKIYVMGGQINATSGETVALEVYDIATNVWDTLEPMPVAVTRAAAATVGGLVYLAGGYPSSGFSLWEYDPPKGTWLERAGMPTARWRPAAVAMEGLLVVAGGMDPSSGYAVPAVEQYNPAGNLWTPMAPMLSPRMDAQAACADARILACGGSPDNGTGATSATELYHSGAGSWRPRPNSPVPAAPVYAGADKEKVFVLAENRLLVYNQGGGASLGGLYLTTAEPLSLLVVYEFEPYHPGGETLGLGVESILANDGVNGTDLLYGVGTGPLLQFEEIAPSILMQPQPLVLDPGDAAFLYVGASGTEPMSYAWYKDNQLVAELNPYELEAVDQSVEGVYHCIVSNTVGEAVSNYVAVSVNDPPAILTHPASRAAAVGGSATFTVSASGTDPLLYGWYKNSSEVPFKEGEENFFAIASVAATHAGSYYCVVSNSAGVAVSNRATLTVGYAPIIQSGPASVTVALGAPATFSVSATGTAPLTYTWFKDIEEAASGSNNAYTVAAAQQADQGLYYCVAANAFGSATSGSAALAVVNPPQITAWTTAITSAVGMEVAFSVTAQGDPPINYAWYKAGVDNPVATTSEYTIASVQPSHAGIYRCRVWNAGGEVYSEDATLTVVVPPSIVTDPASQTVALGGSLMFTVAATGDQPLEYVWYKDGLLLIICPCPSYMISDAQPSDAGEYYCTVRNAGGSTQSARAVLTVGLPPAIVQQPASLVVTAGDAATFQVVAEGTPPLHYEWLKNDEPLDAEDMPSYSIAPVTMADAGEYACRVWNDFGDARSYPATLSVSGVPRAAFSYEPQTGQAPLTVGFTDLSAPGSTPIASWNWDFGDGSSIAQQNPSHTYTAPGIYTVRLTVRNSEFPTIPSTAMVARAVRVYAGAV